MVHEMTSFATKSCNRNPRKIIPTQKRTYSQPGNGLSTPIFKQQDLNLLKADFLIYRCIHYTEDKAIETLHLFIFLEILVRAECRYHGLAWAKNGFLRFLKGQLLSRPGNATIYLNRLAVQKKHLVNGHF